MKIFYSEHPFGSVAALGEGLSGAATDYLLSPACLPARRSQEQEVAASRDGVLGCQAVPREGSLLLGGAPLEDSSSYLVPADAS